MMQLSCYVSLIGEYTIRPSSCSSFQFQCVASRVCIPSAWICDSDRDCSDGSDEVNCNGTSAPCAGFQCNSTSVCLSSDVRCNGYIDCDDGGDERGCPSSENDFVTIGLL